MTKRREWSRKLFSAPERVQGKAQAMCPKAAADGPEGGNRRLPTGGDSHQTL